MFFAPVRYCRGGFAELGFGLADVVEHDRIRLDSIGLVERRERFVELAFLVRRHASLEGGARTRCVILRECRSPEATREGDGHDQTAHEHLSKGYP